MCNRKRFGKRVEAGRVLERRAWLKAAAGLTLGAAAVPAMATDLKTKARKNFRLGIASSVYARLPLEEAARRIKADGFR